MIRRNALKVTPDMRRFAAQAASLISSVSRRDLSRISRLPHRLSFDAETADALWDQCPGDTTLFRAILPNSERVTTMRVIERRVDGGRYGRRLISCWLFSGEPEAETGPERTAGAWSSETRLMFVYMTPDMMNSPGVFDQLESTVLHELVHAFDPKLADRELRESSRAEWDALRQASEKRKFVGAAGMLRRMSPEELLKTLKIAGSDAGLPKSMKSVKSAMERALALAEREAAGYQQAYRLQPHELDAFAVQDIEMLRRLLDQVPPHDLKRAKGVLLGVIRDLTTSRACTLGSLSFWAEVGGEPLRRFVRDAYKVISEYERPDAWVFRDTPHATERLDSMRQMALRARGSAPKRRAKRP